jgi:hypothetical protein
MSIYPHELWAKADTQNRGHPKTALKAFEVGDKVGPQGRSLEKDTAQRGVESSLQPWWESEASKGTHWNTSGRMQGTCWEQEGLQWHRLFLHGGALFPSLCFLSFSGMNVYLYLENRNY